MPRLVVATTNPGKLKEIAQLLAGTPVELATLADYPETPPPAETGRTFAENARLKALFYARHTGDLTVAEDSGLEIDALDGAPGVESARFGGEQSAYPEKFLLIYDALRRRKASGSAARFVCALALVKDGNVLFETRGTVEGKIAPEPRGTVVTTPPADNPPPAQARAPRGTGATQIPANGQRIVLEVNKGTLVRLAGP